MNPEQLLSRPRKSEDLDSIEIDLGSKYLALVKHYFLEYSVYPNEIFEQLRQECSFLHDYKSYHIGYFLENGKFYSFSGFSSLKHVLFNSKSLAETYKVAMIGSAYNPEMSLFVDIDKLSDNYESIFVQNVSELNDFKGRVYVANNIDSLIDKLTLYLVGDQEGLLII